MTVITKFALINRNTYLDIANLDKYDCILRTLFLRISLDFDNQEIVICGKLHISALPEGGQGRGKTSKKKLKNDYKENNFVNQK